MRLESGYIKPDKRHMRTLDSIKKSYSHIRKILNKYKSKKRHRTLDTKSSDHEEPDKNDDSDTGASANDGEETVEEDQDQEEESEKGKSQGSGNSPPHKKHKKHKKKHGGKQKSGGEKESLSPAEAAKREREEIKTAIALIEYKLIEVNELIKECIEHQFQANLMAEKKDILKECAGLNYQILFQNFKEGMRRVKQIFLELIRRKTDSMGPEYRDVIDFFLDILEDFIDKDLKLSESLEVSREAAKYYISAGFYDSLLNAAEPEIKALNAIHKRLHKSRREIQDLIKTKIAERDEYLASLRSQAKKIEKASEEPEEMVSQFEEPDELPDGEEENGSESEEEHSEEKPKEEDQDEDEAELGEPSDSDEHNWEEDEEDEVTGKKKEEKESEEETDDDGGEEADEKTDSAKETDKAEKKEADAEAEDSGDGEEDE